MLRVESLAKSYGDNPAIGDVGFEVNRKLKRGQQRSRRAAVICDRAKAIDHVHDQCPTATMRLAFGESSHGSTNPADSARRGGCHWHRVRRVLHDIAGHAPHRVHLRRYDVFQSFPSTSPPAGVRACSQVPKPTAVTLNSWSVVG